MPHEQAGPLERKRTLAAHAADMAAHYDPLATNDHGAPDDPLDEKHLGDFGNVTADEDGDATRTLTIEDLDLDDALDWAVIVHSDHDDLTTDPGGNSGDRVGCGVVTRQAIAL